MYCVGYSTHSILIDLSLSWVAWRTGRRRQELCRCFKWRQNSVQDTTNSTWNTDEKEAIYIYIYIYILCILSSSMWRGREILFAARDEKAISFRWSPLITHPVYQGLPPLAVETGSLYLEDQCFSIATIWRQSNNNTSPWLSLFSLCFRSIR